MYTNSIFHDNIGLMGIQRSLDFNENTGNKKQLG